jgi:hypothetical protein
MPQLDTIPFASIFISLFIVFFVSYFVFLKYFLPRISSLMKIQYKEQLKNIYWLFVYQFLLLRKDVLSQEAVVKTANLLCALQLVLKFLDLLVVAFIDVLFASPYEKATAYFVKQCISYKEKLFLFF